MEKKVEIFDSTLRDGCQSEGVSYSVKDKLNIIAALDEFGIDFIEAGNPASNPKDATLFQMLSGMKMKNAKIVAFGCTRRKGIKPEDDASVAALCEAGTKYVSIVGKSWDMHVRNVINTTPEENLEMISDTVSYFKARGKVVIFDAEHFFDGYKSNRDYSLKTLEAAAGAGADTIVLCDTNGGSFYDEISGIVEEVKKIFPDKKIGIHTHNDCGLAVANAVAAVGAGATHIQGTLLGYGERCGNASLATVMADLQLKRGIKCVEDISHLYSVCRRVAEIANVKINKYEPFIGRSAFAHKGGMHADGVDKDTASFEHINPESIGNERHFLISEMAGRTALLKKLSKIYPNLTKDSPEINKVVERIKELEFEGYRFEGAEGSFEIAVRKLLGSYKPFFELINYTMVSSYPATDGVLDRATVKIKVGDEIEITAAEGNGPVHALDSALRQALERFYKNLKNMHLVDYKVRILEYSDATAAATRVLIESTDGENSWTTIGVSTDIIQASWIALVDSIEYKLISDSENGII